MAINPEDVCPRPEKPRNMTTEPLVPPIYATSVYRCHDPAQARQLLAGEAPGYVYSRDGHPNADLLAEKCRELHAAERAAVCASGMAAVAVTVLSQLERGDHVVLSNQLYGRTLQLLTEELARLGIGATAVDTCDLDTTSAAAGPKTKMLVVETISNPNLRVADLGSLAELAHQHECLLVVDNTFASPVVCRPLEWGADLVIESLTKIMSGHSDVTLGLVCGSERHWGRVPLVHSAWGFTPSPFDCWLASREIGTLVPRVNRSGYNALRLAEFLKSHDRVESVHYPGLVDHPDHEIARRQFGLRFGSVVTFTLAGGFDAACRFIAAAEHIPFCPSLGDLSTTLSHPASTSHRGLSADEQGMLGITGGTIRLSVGIESPEAVLGAVGQGLDGVG